MRGCKAAVLTSAVGVQASRNCMDAAVASGTSHYVLLSAICVQKPLLEFQRAKLKFEAELQATDALTHSIVRPTAFFKSLAGQVESVKKGGPYVMFGDGHLASCKPISEEDLACFMGDCVMQEDKVNQARLHPTPEIMLTPTLLASVHADQCVHRGRCAYMLPRNVRQKSPSVSYNFPVHASHGLCCLHTLWNRPLRSSNQTRRPGACDSGPDRAAGGRADASVEMQVLPIGGPGEALDPVQQADVLFRLIGSEPKTLKVPVGIMDFVIGTLDGLGKVFPNLKEAAEFGRIGKYYATESMLVYNEGTGQYDAEATPSYGKETLEMFFDRVLKEGLDGQELGDQAVWGQK